MFSNKSIIFFRRNSKNNFCRDLKYSLNVYITIRYSNYNLKIILGYL
jgi:hypothetical protein